MPGAYRWLSEVMPVPTGCPHGQGIEDEYRIFQDVLGAGPALDAYLLKGEEKIRKKF